MRFIRKLLGRRRTRRQIQWGMDYIQSRYGTPAIQHERAFNWYEKGT